MKYILILFISYNIYSCSPKVIHNTKTIDSNKQFNLQKKYSDILKEPIDSIYNLRLYKNLENWNNIKDSLNFKTISYPILFINFMCYKQYNIILPNNYDAIINDEQVYLYRNTEYLHEGDLVFFKEKSNSDNLIGLFLRNKYFTYSTKTGELIYHEVNDTLNTVKVISNAKLYKK